jgi:hypothetical protein
MEAVKPSARGSVNFASVWVIMVTVVRWNKIGFAFKWITLIQNAVTKT